MRLSKFLLPVTLTSMAYGSTFANAENVVQVKSLTTDSQRELIDETHRNLRRGVAGDDVKPEEEGDDEERKGGGGPHYATTTSLDNWFEDNGYSPDDIERLKKLQRQMPMTTKQKMMILCNGVTRRL
ncbi:hypothetical protein DD237_008510 [Peronospora effusa]|uniref:RxLR effector protein n=1 Tax=Peronospora effusa TaxID=542832 RepID=A0A425C311_9STRA|nr:hypothetical protein DD237_008510 [Peronospora effusa]